MEGESGEQVGGELKSVTDRRTDGHMMTACTALCVASRGKKKKNLHIIYTIFIT